LLVSFRYRYSQPISVPGLIAADPTEVL